MPDKLILNIKDGNKNKGVDCVLMLFCKLKPFIWGMQRALNDRLEEKNNSNGKYSFEEPERVAVFFQYLPTFDEYKRNSAACEVENKRCKLF